MQQQSRIWVWVLVSAACGGSDTQIELPEAENTAAIPSDSLDESNGHVLNSKNRYAIHGPSDPGEPPTARRQPKGAFTADGRLGNLQGDAMSGAGAVVGEHGDGVGFGGLGLRGTGRSGGGGKAGKIGLGNVGTIGHGAGGTGSGYGRGAGGMGVSRVRAGSVQVRGSVQRSYGMAGSTDELARIRHNREGYAPINENPFHEAKGEPLSTFSIDVDTASYANTRRYLTSGQRPPASAVRIEEMINYFSYDYGSPKGDVPFSVHTEVTEAPWNTKHRLVHVGIQGKKLDMREAPASNLVFLLDVSGSMNSPDKLGLLKQGLSLLTRNLRDKDRVAIVVYAGSSGLVLPSTSGENRNKILSALERLRAGGSTNGAGGIELAYRVARKNFIEGGVNRVILATDGDFNVGVSSQGELATLIEQKRKSGVFLSVLGFGRGNLQDQKMETLADKGNGNYAYIDSIREAKKVLVREVGSTLVTIAKDVKIQIEFNPAKVKSYRLIGYENRVLAARDFNDDKKDAGEIGAGHSVTALYEVVPVGADSPTGANVDPLRYQKQDLSGAADSGELLTLKIRYKQPTGATSRKLEWTVRDGGRRLAQASHNERIAAGIAAFGMLLRDSKHKGTSSYSMVKDLVRPTLATDSSGDRAELFHLINQAESIGG